MMLWWRMADGTKSFSSALLSLFLCLHRHFPIKPQSFHSPLHHSTQSSYTPSFPSPGTIYLTFLCTCSLTSSTLLSPSPLTKLANVTAPEIVSHTFAHTPIAILVL
jgi:hypothetical protein